jgi:hypothetical protein
MTRGGILKKGAAALLLGSAILGPMLALTLSAGQILTVPIVVPFGTTAHAQDSVTTVIVDESGDEPVDTSTPIYLYTHDTCRSIFAAAAPDPQGACDCMTPILMQRLTQEARERIVENPDQLPFGVALFRDATPVESAAQRACME